MQSGIISDSTYLASRGVVCHSIVTLIPFRSRWPPVDKFLALGGVTTCLQVVAMAFDWTFAGRAEMVRAALEVLLVCSVMPRYGTTYSTELWIE